MLSLTGGSAYGSGKKRDILEMIAVRKIPKIRNCIMLPATYDNITTQCVVKYRREKNENREPTSIS